MPKLRASAFSTSSSGPITLTARYSLPCSLTKDSTCIKWCCSCAKGKIKKNRQDGLISGCSASRSWKRQIRWATFSSHLPRPSQDNLTYMVVNKDLDSLLWIMKVTKPQEKLGEEWSGLLDENANQNHWQCLILHSVRRGEKSQLMYHIRHISSHSNCKTCLESFEQTSALPWTLWGFADLHHTQCSRSQTSIFEECSFPGSLAAAAKGNLPCYVLQGRGVSLHPPPV